jgi:hypothetical protein
MVPGVAGSLVKANDAAVEFPQVLKAITETVPVVNPEGTLIVMLVPRLVTIEHPAAGVHVYPVAPATAAMLYVKVPPPQRLVVGPLMVPGVVGKERTVAERSVLFPQALPATTEMVPLEYTAGSVRLIELVP